MERSFGVSGGWRRIAVLLPVCNIEGHHMESAVIKRSVVLDGHKTSVSLEDAFWGGLKEIGKGRNTTLSALITSIDASRLHGNLSSAIRLFVLDHFYARTLVTSTILAAAPQDMPQMMQDGHRFRQGNGRASE
jgi:predicted DNA-binding ribbon-helix-helix protein